MSELEDFADGLREIMDRMGTPGLRPFICDGSPLDCSVFLVGSNPATPMNHSFWDFWSDERGFNKEQFMLAYKETRWQRGKTQLSPTRYTLEWVVSAAAPAKCLETNVYANPGDGGVKRLRPEDLNPEPFHFLLDRIKPRLVVAHGGTAKKYLEQLELNCSVKFVSHFSSQVWFDISLIETLRKLRE